MNNKALDLFMMRHGHAERQGVCDHERYLTEQGKQDVTKIANWLAQQPVTIDHVMVSPYLRTRQTLLTLREKLLLPTEEISTALEPYGDVVLINNYLHILLKENCHAVLLISHLPLLSRLIVQLLGEKAVLFRTATLVHLLFSDSGVTLVESITP